MVFNNAILFLILIFYTFTIINAQIRVEKTVNAPRFYLPKQDTRTNDIIYRYVAIATGSEPGNNGHPGLTLVQKKVYKEGIFQVTKAVAKHYNTKIIPGDGVLSYQEAVMAKVLGAYLYRPFFISNRYDFYGRRFLQAMNGIMKEIDGIPADSINFMIQRAANGQPIHKGQNGAREYFDDIGKRFQPYALRREKKQFGGFAQMYIERMRTYLSKK